MSSGLRSGGDVANVLVGVQALGVKERKKDLSIGDDKVKESFGGCTHARASEVEIVIELRGFDWLGTNRPCKLDKLL